MSIHCSQPCFSKSYEGLTPRRANGFYSWAHSPACWTAASSPTRSCSWGSVLIRGTEWGRAASGDGSRHSSPRPPPCWLPARPGDTHSPCVSGALRKQGYAPPGASGAVIAGHAGAQQEDSCAGRPGGLQRARGGGLWGGDGAESVIHVNRSGLSPSGLAQRRGKARVYQQGCWHVGSGLGARRPQGPGPASACVSLQPLHGVHGGCPEASTCFSVKRFGQCLMP